ncbi:toxin-antitoxin (TA) system antitoxin [bacterium]|nr:toxin-antitoxin (TA) system antitoxin [bacterium]MBU1753783.1 toxin-antitoxin (TA) system antitoxin [bacterium]
MTTQTVDVHDAQTKLHKLLSLALEGNEVIIAEDNRLMAKLVPFFPFSVPPKSRIAGLNKDKIWVSKDFNEPLSDEFWIGAK